MSIVFGKNVENDIFSDKFLCDTDKKWRAAVQLSTGDIHGTTCIYRWLMNCSAKNIALPVAAASSLYRQRRISGSF